MRVAASKSWKYIGVWRFQPRAHGNPCFGGLARLSLGRGQAPFLLDFHRLGLAGAAKTKAWIALVKIPSHMTATGTMKATSDDSTAIVIHRP